MLLVWSRNPKIFSDLNNHNGPRPEVYISFINILNRDEFLLHLSRKKFKSEKAGVKEIQLLGWKIHNPSLNPYRNLLNIA